MKIIINRKYGGFWISNIALEELMQRKGETICFYEMTFDDSDKYTYTKTDASNNNLFVAAICNDFGDVFIPENDEQSDEFYKHIIRGNDWRWRTDTDLINLIVEKGSEFVSSPLSSLEIVEIPDDIEWEIEEYDGMEWISEKHRSWY
ncbi:MAG: hypothetical protein KIC65_09595 [Firmicutes bacterium]|nr:hypothetical protein [Bacillota bacterium]